MGENQRVHLSILRIEKQGPCEHLERGTMRQLSKHLTYINFFNSPNNPRKTETILPTLQVRQPKHRGVRNPAHRQGPWIRTHTLKLQSLHPSNRPHSLCLPHCCSLKQGWCFQSPRLPGRLRTGEMPSLPLKASSLGPGPSCRREWATRWWTA